MIVDENYSGIIRWTFGKTFLNSAERKYSRFINFDFEGIGCINPFESFDEYDYSAHFSDVLPYYNFVENNIKRIE